MHMTLCCLSAVTLLAIAGCAKKAEPGSPAPATPTKAQTPVPVDTAAATKTQAPAAPSLALPAVDTTTPVSEVQAQAQTMSVENLKAMALKYKQAIVDKQAQVEKLMAKLKEIPLTEALGKEAQTLKVDLQNLQGTVTALKERFQVYYNTLKEKGASLAGLEI